MAFSHLGEERVRDITTMIIVMLRLGLSGRAAAVPFEVDETDVPSLLAKRGFRGMGQIPGWKRGLSRAGDQVRRQIEIYLESFEINAANDSVPESLRGEFRTALEQCRDAIVDKPRATYTPRIIPEAVIKRLRGHRLGARTIADITGFNISTVGLGIQALESGAVQPCPESEDEGFASALSEYAELIYGGACCVEGDIEDKPWYLRVLKKYLKVEELLAYLLAVEENRRRLQSIGRTPAQEPYARLFLAAAGYSSGQEPERLPTKVVTDFWERYLRCLQGGSAGEIPQSGRALGLALAAEIEGAKRDKVWPDWTDEMSTILEAIMVERLDDRRRETVRLYYGFGRCRHPLNEIAERLGVTTSRAGQYGQEALLRIRKDRRFGELRRWMAPFGYLREELVRVDEEMRRLQVELGLANERVFTLEARLQGVSLPPMSESTEWNENLFKRVDELEMSVRAANCLQAAQIEFIYQLVSKTEAELLKTKNFGRKSLNEIKELLAELGLQLGMRLKGFIPPIPGKSRI